LDRFGCVVGVVKQDILRFGQAIRTPTSPLQQNVPILGPALWTRVITMREEGVGELTKLQKSIRTHFEK